jgi:outer membrane lipoprotein-sorting protein
MRKKSLILWFLLISAVMSFAARDSFAYTAEYKQVMENADGNLIIYDVWVDGAKMRMDTEAEGEKSVLLIREDGVFAYMPARNTYVKITAMPKWPEGSRNPMDFAAWLKGQEKESLGTEVMNGYPCDVFRYRDQLSGSIVTVWIWQGKDFPVKIVFTGGRIESNVSFRDITLGEPIPPETFQIPKNAAEYNPNSLGAMFDAMREAEDSQRDRAGGK